MHEGIIRRAAFILALSIPFNLAGCNLGGTEKETTTKSIKEPKVNEDKVKSSFSEKDLTNFLVSISEITPTYNLEEIYFNDKEIKEIFAVRDTYTECDNTDISLDVDSIYNNLESRLVVTYDLSVKEKQELREKAATSLKVAITNMLNNGSISKEDACTFQNLCIIIGPNEGAFIDDYNGISNMLTIDYYKFKEDYDNIESDSLREEAITEGFIKCFELGLNTCRLRACDCRLFKGQINMGALYNKSFNPLERAAVFSGNNSNLLDYNKLIFNQAEVDTGYVVSPLLLLGVFKENRTIEDLNKLLFDSNLPGICEYFGLKTEREFKEFYKILTTVNLLNYDEKYEASFYEENNTTNLVDYRNHLGYAYKASIFKTSISDLMKSIVSTKSISKEEAMFLYKFVKSICVNQTYTEIDEGEYHYDPKYVSDIIGIENIFFEFMSRYYDLTLDEVDELYEDYYLFSNLNYGSCLFGVDTNKLINMFPLLGYIEKYYAPSNFYVEPFDGKER